MENEPKNLNDAERAAWESLKSQGCTVLRDGWPDFLCVSDTGRIFAVEVKSQHDICTPKQYAIHQSLRAAGIPVYVIAEPCTDDACRAEKPRTHAAMDRDRRLPLDRLTAG